MAPCGWPRGRRDFAASTGAALIPIFVVPFDGGYRLQVEPPLHAESDQSAVAEEEFISAYLPVLERYVVQYPTIWRGWLGSPTYWAPEL